MKRAISFVMLLVATSIANASIVEDMRYAALDNQCLEQVVGQMIQEQGVEQAANIVAAAYMILSEPGVEKRQKALGCTGAIGQAAILAGVDPGLVLEATAAGEGGSPLSAPAGLGAPGIIGGVYVRHPSRDGSEYIE